MLGRAEPLPPPDFQDRKRRIKPIHEIKTIVLHSMYDGYGAYHDLSIVTLQGNVDLSRYIFPICVPQQPEDEKENEKRYGNKVVVTGFRNQRNPEVDNKLHQISPRIQTQSLCNSVHSNIDESDFDILTAARNSLPNLFTSSIFCARDIGFQGGIQAE